MISSASAPLLSAGPLRKAETPDRILAAAYDLFSRHGIRAVGIDAIIEESGAARTTLYRRFTSKEQLVLAFLEQREVLMKGSIVSAAEGDREAGARAKEIATLVIDDARACALTACRARSSDSALGSKARRAPGRT